MLISEKKIGFIGAGNMAEAMIQAFKDKLKISENNLFISETNIKRREELIKKFKVKSTDSNTELVINSDIIILAIKPQQMKEVLLEIRENKTYKDLDKKKLFISIAAGIKLDFLADSLKKTLKEEQRKLLSLIRAMPNTPGLAASGITGISQNQDTGKEDLAIATELMQALGKTCFIDEKLMDALTALSGSGPAYVFLFAEAMILAGKKLGLSEADAKLLSIETIKGAARLMEDEDPKVLREKVTSPQGTTAAAIESFKKGGFEELIYRAILAASIRSKELSEDFS